MNAPIEHLAPAILYGMSNEAYHADQSAISKSGLDQIAKSPAHYYAAYLDPQRPPRKTTAAMSFGTLAHCLTLEPDQFASRYIVIPEDAPRRPSKAQRGAKKPSDDTLKAISYWDELEASKGDREIITRADFDAVAADFNTGRSQIASLMAKPDIAELLASGRPEVSIYWTDAETGVRCKCRVDWLHECAAGKIPVDLKTTRDASPHGFQKAVWNMRYFVQDAFYRDGVAAAFGQDVLAFVFAAVESEYPYLAAPYMLDDEAIEAGRAEYRRNLRTFAECVQAGEWPGYSNAIELLSLPKWAINN